MDYEKTEEAVRYQKACENVKQIAEVIKKIKMKYYPNFASISVEDKEKYDTLTKQMQKISIEHNLHNLSKALIAEISRRYDGTIPEVTAEDIQSEEAKNKLKNEIKDMCYGATESEIKILNTIEGGVETSNLRFQKAMECQEQFSKGIKLLETTFGKEETIEILQMRKNQFMEICKKRTITTEQWLGRTEKLFFKPEDAQKRNEFVQAQKQELAKPKEQELFVR